MTAPFFAVPSAVGGRCVIDRSRLSDRATARLLQQSTRRDRRRPLIARSARIVAASIVMLAATPAWG